MGILDFFKNKKISSDKSNKEHNENEVSEAVSIEESKEDDNPISPEVGQRLINYYAMEKAGFMDEFNIDPLFWEAAKIAISSQVLSVSTIQRTFSIGYNRAGRITEQLERAGIVGKSENSHPRNVLVKDLKGEAIELFLKANEDEISEKVKYYEDILRKKRERAIVEAEKEAIKRELLEKNRKREIREAALRELREEGLISNVRKREPIPQEVQDIVWNRDGGKCVKCGSNEKLEFDHIIPFSKGGSNNARNLQLLCEKCNREKSNKIG